MSTTSTKGPLLLGFGGLSIAALSYYLYNTYGKGDKRRSNLENITSVDRNTIVKVLKDLKKEMFTVFQNFAAISQNIKHQSMGRARPEEIRMMLLEQPLFRGEIEQVEEAVYSSHGVTKDQVRRCCEHTYREDPEIKELQRSMKEQFDKSFQGISPDSKTEIPAFLTPDLTFEILHKVMVESALRLNEKLLELQEAGEQLNPSNPKMMEVMQTMKMDASKREILNSYGLNRFDDPGSKILQYATQIYTQQNKDGFNQRMAQLETVYQSVMEILLMQGPMSNEEVKQKLEAPQKQAGHTQPLQSNQIFQSETLKQEAQPAQKQPQAEEQPKSPKQIERQASMVDVHSLNHAEKQGPNDEEENQFEAEHVQENIKEDEEVPEQSDKNQNEREGEDESHNKEGH